MPANVLNLSRVTLEKVSVIDRYNKEWPIHDGLPLRTALALMELAPAWEEGHLDAAQIEKTIDGVLAVFRRTNTDVTKDDLLDNFDVEDLIQIILFLSSRAEARNQSLSTAATADVELEDTSPSVSGKPSAGHTATPTPLATARTRKRS